MKPDAATSFTFPVRPHGKFLATREPAKLVLRELQDKIPANTYTLVIDFTGVDAMTHSYCDEFLARYYATLASTGNNSDSTDRSPATVLLTGLEEDVRETITICLERSDLIALEDRDGQPFVLAASAVLNETFEAARQLGTFTALQLAERMRVTAPNANNRLKRLVAARALLRRPGVAERGGKEFTYAVPELSPRETTAV
ncbi:hypothetical protein ABT297_31220 [Dactylosporangium sp. NPDC000555]|uniref:hypothetical protein n=1 Tax=Dactylosporangium sp. NPDC000555 TaxID=3154260 RepID=UPI0033300F2B